VCAATGAAIGVLTMLATALGPAAQSSAANERDTTTMSHTVWLCRPGQAHDPCTSSLAATSVAANGATTQVSAHPARASKFDCFFVYPTVSGQLTDNSNLKVEPAETGAAEDEAARFSQECNVWAPMYRQRTEFSLTKGLGEDPKADLVAYKSLLSAWKDYLAHDNHGRPVIFIGHSQGAAMLIRLLANQIDPNAKLRARMVSAIILGGNVQVPIGQDVGGSFQHIPICTAVQETRCVIAYSTFGSLPPPTALFSRPGQGVSLQSGQSDSTGEQVACVNPVNYSSGTGMLLPYFLSVVSVVKGIKIGTPWVSYPDLYTATCQSSGGATWLQINAAVVAGDPRPKVTASLGPNWGYHLNDVNLALGNLVFDVALQENAYH
jgi:DUF3089 family protein